MPYRAAKISFDGSHYIATPKENFLQGHKRRRPAHPLSEQETEQKEQFETAYKESQQFPKKERKAYMRKAMKDVIPDRKQRKAYVERHNERKQTNAIRRRVRLSKKVNLQREWNFFCTFTFSDKLHTEETFKKSLRNTLKHLVNRKGWKYIGVWERSPQKKRLHFHSVFHIPEGTLSGEMEEVNSYSFATHKRQITMQNSFFLKRFGRNDFEKITDENRVGDALSYLMKYIEKSGEKIVYSRGLPQFFISDVMDEDVACTMGEEQEKLVLHDDFGCWVDGEYMGKVSKDTISKMPKAN